jgi:drug/metabolite transporter (DMT)-like permease
MKPLARFPALAIWSALALIWGSTWLFIKVGLQDLPPFTFAGVRFAVAVVPLALYLAARRVPMPRGRSEWSLLLFTGTFSLAGSYGLVFWGEQYISSGLTALLFSTYPFFGLVFAHTFLATEPLRPRKLAGVLLGIAGVAVLFADQLGMRGEAAAWGAAGILLSAALAAISGVLVKARGGHLDPVAVSFWQMAIGGVPLMAAGVLLEGNPLRLAWTGRAIASLLYLALVGTSLAFVLWYRLLQSTEVTRVQVMPLLNTVVAALLGWAILDETYGLEGILGGAVVLAGLALTLYAPSRPPRPRRGGKDRGPGPASPAL